MMVTHIYLMVFSWHQYINQFLDNFDHTILVATNPSLTLSSSSLVAASCCSVSLVFSLAVATSDSDWLS